MKLSGWRRYRRTASTVREELTSGREVSSVPVSYTHLDVYKRQGAIIENLRISGQPKPHSPQSCPGRTVAATLSSMRLSGHIIGLLKEYMRDLVEQARQESQAQEAFGFSAPPYQPDHAIADLLAILDDRIESEGVQVGLPIEFLHEMWRRCNEARSEITDRVWLETRCV